jgi:hypothetical protein
VLHERVPDEHLCRLGHFIEGLKTILMRCEKATDKIDYFLTIARLLVVFLHCFEVLLTASVSLWGRRNGECFHLAVTKVLSEICVVAVPFIFEKCDGWDIIATYME